MTILRLRQQIGKRLGGGSANRLIMRAAVIVAAATFGVKLISAVKESVVASVFGLSDAVDAFVIASLLPAFVVSLIGNSCNAALIPTYIDLREREGAESAQNLLSQTMLVSTGLFLAITGVLALVGPTALAWLAPTFNDQKLILTRQLFYLSLPQVLLSGVATIWQAVLNARERFALGAAAPVLVPIASIAAMLAAPRELAIYALAISMVIGFVLQLAVLGFALRRQGIRLMPRWHGGGAALGQVIGQYWPLVVGGLLVYSTPIVDRAMASTLPAGSVAALNYAYKVAQLIIGITTTALSTALIPYLSKMIARADWRGVRHSLKTYAILILVGSVPLVIALALGSEQIVSLIYRRGAFSAEDARLVAQVQTMYVLQIPFYTLHILFVRLISSLRGNKVLVWGTLINCVLNVVFDYLLLRFMGLPGIALANTAVYLAKLIFVAVVGYWLLARREREGQGE
jgi:putative peptidoglycan lipid II flippase